MAVVRTTPVLPLGKMKDLITPVLPLAGGSVGINCEGSPTALPGAMSLITARANLRFGVVATSGESPVGLLSTPFVSLFAAQFAIQLKGYR